MFQIFIFDFGYLHIHNEIFWKWDPTLSTNLFILVLGFLFLFLYKVSLCSPDIPRTLCKSGCLWTIWDPPASASHVLRLKVCPTTSSCEHKSWCFIFVLCRWLDSHCMWCDFVVVALFCFVFWDRVSLCNSFGYPGTLFVDQAGLKLCLLSAGIKGACHNCPGRMWCF